MKEWYEITLADLVNGPKLDAIEVRAREGCQHESLALRPGWKFECRGCGRSGPYRKVAEDKWEMEFHDGA